MSSILVICGRFVSFDVPSESQMLVFSKTSLQRHRIAPAHAAGLVFQ